jgi:DNA gyrase subunit A
MKRTVLTDYKVQNRGGRGVQGGATRDEDFIEHIFVASTHNYMLFFTEQGRCFWLKVYEIPEGGKNTKGRAVQNMISIPPDDKIRAYIAVKTLSDEEYLQNTFIMFCTKKGLIKKTSLEAYSRPRINGINAININEDDQLLEARLTTGNSEVLLAIKSGRAIRFNESKVRAMGRTATGVRGITLDNEVDEVVGMVCVDDQETTIMVISETGYGKRSDLDAYRMTNRGGKGVRTLSVTEKTGQLVGILDITDEDDLMIINQRGVTIRMGAADLRVMGRATQGVRLIRLKDGESIASITKVRREEDIEESVEGQDPDQNTPISPEENEPKA